MAAQEQWYDETLLSEGVPESALKSGRSTHAQSCAQAWVDQYEAPGQTMRAAPFQRAGLLQQAIILEAPSDRCACAVR